MRSIWKPSGKTYWLVNYLTKVDDRFDCIIWISNQLSAEQELINELKKKLGNTFMLKVIGLTENQELTEI